jgi:cobalamin biosynthesis Mg chelatase CobN
MPGPAAEARGAQAAQAILDAHRAANGGAYPETVAINLWGLDAIKTKGESVAMVLHMVGARPVKEGTGRIARWAALPTKAYSYLPLCTGISDQLIIQIWALICLLHLEKSSVYFG